MSGALLIALIACVPADDAAQQARDRAWQGFPVFVWFSGGPQEGPAAFDALRRHGLLGCNVEGNDTSDVAAKSAAPYYVDHLAGKGDLWLRQPEIDADQKRLAADLLGCKPVRPNCFNSTDVVARLDRRVDEGVRHHAPHQPLAYVLDDELSVTRGVCPLDYCFGAECLAGLRSFALARYGSLAQLNAAWETRFAQQDDVVPPTTEAAREANAARPLAQLSFTAWSDHREFMEQALAARLGELADRVRAVDPGAPVGFTGGELPSAFGGFDWWLLLEKQTLVEAYEGGLAPELIHGLKHPGTKVLTTWFVPDDEKARATWSPWENFGRVARGDDGAVVWSSGAIFDPSGAELNAAGVALAETVAAARTVRAALAKARRPPADVVVLASQPSVRATWMVDSWVDGRTWPRRLTSWESDHSSSGAARADWDAVAGALGLASDFVDVRELSGKETLASRGARIVVLPELVALSDGDVAKLLQFATDGGLVVADALPLLFDERLHGRDDSALRRLFGVARDGGQRLGDLATVVQRSDFDASGAVVAEAGRLKAEAAVASGFAGFVKEHGRGAAWLLDRRLSGLAHDPKRLAQFAAGFEAELARRGRSTARTRFALADAGRVRWQRWADGEAELLIGTCSGPDGGPVAAHLAFPRATRVRELLGRSLDDVGAVAAEPLVELSLRIDRSHPLLLRCEAK